MAALLARYGRPLCVLYNLDSGLRRVPIEPAPLDTFMRRGTWSDFLGSEGNVSPIIAAPIELVSNRMPHLYSQRIIVHGPRWRYLFRHTSCH